MNSISKSEPIVKSKILIIFEKKSVTFLFSIEIMVGRPPRILFLINLNHLINRTLNINIKLIEKY